MVETNHALTAKRGSIFSAARDEPTIQEGSLVIIYLSRDLMQTCLVVPEEVTNTKYGSFKHSSMVGMRFGSKMVATSGRGGFCHLLRPTPELWSMSLRHRTQILYMPDIAFITSYLDLKPGSRVIEAGTGSGSFSHSVARTIGSSGKLYSFEFHEQRTEQARQEFANHGLLDTIELEHRNVCRDGFGSANDVDAVFLDLPAPWEAIEDAKRAMAKDRITRICCFSPCIEQVTRTVTALHEHGFSSVTMYETLIRQHDMISYTVPTIDDTIEKLRDIEVRKKLRHETQVEQSRIDREAKKQLQQAKADGNDTSSKRKAADIEDAEEATEPKKPREGEGSDVPQEVTTAGAPLTAPDGVAGAELQVAAPEAPLKATVEPTSQAPNGKDKKQPAKDDKRESNTKPAPQIRGHTSYLTFAFLLPNGPDTSAFLSSATEADSFAQEYNALTSQDLAGVDLENPLGAAADPVALV